MTGTATKTSLENKHLGNSEYFVIIASSSHPLSLIEHAANRLVEAPLKEICVFHVAFKTVILKFSRFHLAEYVNEMY